jgi:PBP1b-binding outer membrane lipoprotein LpoB
MATVGLALVAVLLAGCAQSAQSKAQDNVTATDVTACHFFAASVFHTTSPITQATTDQMLADLKAAKNTTLQSEEATLESKLGAGDQAATKTALEDIASTCNGLGLIDAKGNPT